MEVITRLINASSEETKKMSPMQLKESIRKSEGRVVMGQHLLFAGPGLIRGVNNSELMAVFGADMILLNTFDVDHPDQNPGMTGYTIKELKEKCHRPVGVYLGCMREEDSDKTKAIYRASGMAATNEHVRKVIDMGADFIILGGNPGSGTSIEDVITWTKRIKDEFGDKVFLFSGKWEDGVYEKVLGDPTASYDPKEMVKKLIDAGADCIDFPAPGSRNGISVRHIQELVEIVHTYKPGTLAMCFLNSSVENADTDTIRQVGLMMKETGADVMAIGDGGFGGCSNPENIYQLSVTLKGKSYTYYKMASK